MAITMEKWRRSGRHQQDIEAALRRWEERFQRYLQRQRAGPAEVKRLYLERNPNLDDNLIDSQMDWEYFGDFGYELPAAN